LVRLATGSRVFRVGFFATISGILTPMTSDNAEDLEPTIFSAVITPHRSLGRVGFLVLMGIFGGVSFVAGMLFLLDGAWPVFGFFGLDVALLYWAFRLNYSHAAAYEEVTVTPAALTVRKVSHRGRVREWVLNPLWVKLDKVVHEEFGIERLFLVSRGKQLAIASFLGPDEKASFATALGNALSEARRGVTRTVIP
jgi:uncharacterized membrane protein